MSAWEYFKGRLLHDLFWIAVPLAFVVVGLAGIVAVDWFKSLRRRKP